MLNETIKQVATVFPIDSEALKPDPKYRRRISIVKEFSLNTSTHGIPGIARSQTIRNRLFWSLSLLIFTGIMIYFVVQSIIAYFQYPTQTDVSIVVEWPQAFPAVSVCNYSPIRYDRFNDSFFEYLQKFNLTNETDLSNFTSQQTQHVSDFLVYKLNRNESIQEYLYSLKSMLLSGDFNGLPCTAENFTWFMSPQYGLCYTFNAKMKNMPNGGFRNNADNGGTGILTLRFYIHQHQYVPYMSLASGIVMLIHDNSKLPQIEMAGMLLGTGRHHRLTYTVKKNTFLSEPYTKCADKPTVAMQALLNQYNGTDYGYSQFECFVPCAQAYMYEKCGCGSPFRWNARFVTLFGTNTIIQIPLCNIANPCYRAAEIEIVTNVPIWSKYCPDCQQECSSVTFNIRPSSLSAPPAFLFDNIKEFVEYSDVPLPVNWSTTWMNEIQSNYVSFEVVSESTRTEIYTQQGTIQPVDVISNVGGQTGLWIGISFLSLMEIVEMLFRLVRRQCYSFRKKIQRIFQKEEDSAL